MRSPRRRRWRWVVGALALLVVLAFLVAALIDEPMRRRVEAGMNAALDGYTVKIGKLDFHPLGFSLDLVDWVVVQDANPDPPIASIPKLHASVEWRALLHGKLVADFRFDRPAFHIDLRHAEKEATDEKPVEARGWQEAAFAVYPLKINLLRIVDGELTYTDKGPLEPLHVTKIDFHAGNIRNVRSKEGEYPSDVHLYATVLDTAHLRADGHADFFAMPTAALKADYDLTALRLGYIAPILQHYDVTVRGGTLSSRGELEYAPKTKKVHVADTTLERADLTYVKRRAEQPSVGEQTTKAAATVTQKPEVAVRVDRLKIAKSQLAYRDETTDPPYRLFVTDCDANVTNFSNVRAAGDEPGKATINAKFMGQGPTRVDAVFRPQQDRTDFDLWVRIEDTDLRTMNDVWRAYGKFDVEKGTFSLYSEIGVQNGEVHGYVKPIFHEIDVFDPGEDKGVGQKLYEGIVGGAATLLTNPPHEQVATKTDLSGRLDAPRTNVLQVMANLIRNAFFQAILPGLEGSRGKKDRE